MIYQVAFDLTHPTRVTRRAVVTVAIHVEHPADGMSTLNDPVCAVDLKEIGEVLYDLGHRDLRITPVSQSVKLYDQNQP